MTKHPDRNPQDIKCNDFLPSFQSAKPSSQTEPSQDPQSKPSDPIWCSLICWLVGREQGTPLHGVGGRKEQSISKSCCNTAAAHTKPPEKELWCRERSRVRKKRKEAEKETPRWAGEWFVSCPASPVGSTRIKAGDAPNNGSGTRRPGKGGCRDFVLRTPSRRLRRRVNKVELGTGKTGTR